MGGRLLVEHPDFRFKYSPKNPRRDEDTEVQEATEVQEDTEA